MAEETGIIHNIVGKCKVCRKSIDNAFEPYITDADGSFYHVSCYAQSLQVTGRRGRTQQPF